MGVSSDKILAVANSIFNEACCTPEGPDRLTLLIMDMAIEVDALRDEIDELNAKVLTMDVP